MLLSLPVAAAILLAPAHLNAAEVAFTVTDVRSAEGVVYVALCPEAQFLSDECDYNASAVATEGDTVVTFEDVPPGVYGVQSFHDANANGEMDQNLVGWPLEGFAFANDPTIRLRAPSFEASSVVIGEEDVSFTMRMRYR